jgi:trans-2,3-dihydro-3-hydroxyanthranilate isomerase
MVVFGAAFCKKLLLGDCYLSASLGELIMAEFRRFAYVQLDVFTSKKLEGNQLAVFTDARGLSDPEMQRIAKETNLSETTFIFPRDESIERERGCRVRIFTVEEELEFAGHPTLGTAFYIAQRDKKHQVDLDLNVGKIPVAFSEREGLTFGEMRQRDPHFGQIHNHADVARAIGVRASDLDDSLPIQTVSTGMGFAIVPFRSLKTLQNITFSFAQAADYLAKTDAKFLYFVCRETVDPKATLHARMIFYNGEDPATGSAAGCCAGWAVAHGVASSDTLSLIEQGIEMRRPSRIFFRADKTGDTVVNVRVGGNVVEVFAGEAIL